MSYWSTRDIESADKVFGASLTDVPITKEFKISAGGALDGMLIKLSVSSVTAGAGITAKLQSGYNGVWVDAKTVSITADGDFYIKLLGRVSADQAFLPLQDRGRVVVTTGAGSAVTVDTAFVSQAG